MEWISSYFKLKIIAGIILVTIVLIALIYAVVSVCIKDWILKTNGFKYDKGLGTNVAVEFQSRYVRGNKYIRYKEVDRMSLIELTRRIKEIKGE